jgi:phenylalanyl-tRNA synthetase beta chain
VLAADGRELGWIGELHPLAAQAWELDGPVAAFEIDFGTVAELAQGESRYRDVTTFPGVLQDIAVVVPEEVPAAEVEAAVRAGGGELLDRLAVFDLYHGEQVGEDRKSLALRLEFRAPDRTLTDEEVAERRAAIERELAGIGGRLRV